MATAGMVEVEAGTDTVAAKTSRANERRLPMVSIRPQAQASDSPPAAGGTRMLNIRVVTWSLGLFGIVTFLVCVLYGLIVPEPLHMRDFLETVLPGFRWLTFGGFVIGLVESFLYGIYVGLVFTPIYNLFARKWNR